MASSQPGESIRDNSKFDVLKNVQVAACLMLLAHGFISLDWAAKAADLNAALHAFMTANAVHSCARHGTCQSRRRYQSSASGVTSLSRQRSCWLLHDQW